MNYPIWDVPVIGGGLLIGFVSILHAFVSHFAIGGSLFLVLTERKAYRENDLRILDYVKLHSRFFLLLTLVFGAITGVGIWFTIGLVHPPATSALIHIFVWAWAIEWVTFLIEISAAFIYYYTWERLDRRTHLIVGWIYFVAAWLSLAVINGILSFMLTPGQWILTRNFWDGFFNPTYLPSLVLRTAVCFALAGLYALLTASRLQQEELREKLVRYAARWLAPAFVVLPLAGVWYISRIPPLAREVSMGGAAAVTIFAGLSIVFSIIIFSFAYFGPYRNPKQFPFPFAVMFLLIGLLATGVTEWVREAVRKPYIIYDYMYSNAFLVAHEGQYRLEGSLTQAKWVVTRKLTDANIIPAGRDLFELQCQSCHTIDGYNAIRPLLRNWPEDYIDHQLENLQTLKGFMPPFLGTPGERRALARWLATLNGNVLMGAASGNGGGSSLADSTRGGRDAK
ncbi:MAG: cytochrome ubiquinol oxidase subunit I [Bacteroidota bacterium]